MTLPPVVEVREAYKRPDYSSPSGFVFWAQLGGTEPSFGSWKSNVFARIAKLERGLSAPGFGNFRVSEEAAAQLRLQLTKVSLQSLPFPLVAAISGQGVHIDWRSGTRALEVTAFADGELVFEAMEAGNPVELADLNSLDSYLKWLVQIPQDQQQYAAAR